MGKGRNTYASCCLVSFVQTCETEGDALWARQDRLGGPGLIERGSSLLPSSQNTSAPECGKKRERISQVIYREHLWCFGFTGCIRDRDRLEKLIYYVLMPRCIPQSLKRA